MEKTFRPSQSRNTFVWGLVLVAIVDIPLLFFFLGSQGPKGFLIILGIIFLLVDGLIFSLTFLAKKMSYVLGDNDFTVNFGLSKRVIPYTSISEVQLSHVTLLLRLFGASWPGLHWGLYKIKDIGNVWVYSTKMRGNFILVNLVGGNKIAISPEDPESFLNEINAWKSSFRKAGPGEFETIETSRKVVYIQVLMVATAYIVFLGYLLWIYPSLPEIIPVHFDLNWNPNRWANKSELFLIAGVAALFPAFNTVLTLKFGRYGKELTIFLGVIFIFVIALFFWIVYITQSLV